MRTSFNGVVLGFLYFTLMKFAKGFRTPHDSIYLLFVISSEIWNLL